MQIQLRRGLQWSRISTRTGFAWTVTDPISRVYLRLGEHERWIAENLKPGVSIDAIIERFQRHFPRLTIDRDAIGSLVELLVGRGFARLVVHPPESALATTAVSGTAISGMGTSETATSAAGRPPSSRTIQGPGTLRTIRNTFAWLAQLPWRLLFGKLSIWNPNDFLHRIAPGFGWWVGPKGVLAFCLLLAATSLLVVSRWTQFCAELPSLVGLLSPQSLLGFGVAFVATRIIHELGHALVCVRLRAKCVDTGVFLMMGIACPYVDVTDSWRLPSSRQRAAVSLAGIYAELTVAAVAGIVWWMTHVGPVHLFAWQIMVVCGISTFLFNANPLMRYDGYYVLSDLLDIPNLRDKATRCLQRTSARKIFGYRDPRTKGSSRRTQTSRLLALFGAATLGYRLLLVSSIGWLIFESAHQWRVGWLGAVIIGLLAIGTVGMPLAKAIRWTIQELRTGGLKPVRTGLAWILLIGLSITAFCLPIPQRLSATGTVTASSASPVYVRVDGIVQNESHGQTVRLVRANDRQRLERLEAEIHVVESLELLRRTQRRAFDEQALLESLPELQSRLDWSLARLDHHRQREAENVLVSSGQFPTTTRFVSAPAPGTRSAIAANQHAISSQAMRWDDVSADGRYAASGSLVGWKIFDAKPRVEIMIDVEELPWVQVGYTANVRFQQNPTTILPGVVAAVSAQRADTELASLSPTKGTIGGLSNELAYGRESSGSGQAKYKVEIELLARPADGLLLGGHADVVIRSEKRALASIVKDWVYRNFRVR
jgi:putative peptide zinc metalloprotease protein